MDETALQCGDHGLGPVVHIEPHENHIDVTFHRTFGDAKDKSYLSIALSTRDQGEHLALAGAEIGTRSPRGQSVANNLRQVLTPSTDAAQGPEQDTMGHSFDDVAFGTRSQRLINVLIALISGEDDKTRFRMRVPYGTDGIDTAETGETQIHERNVGQMLGKPPHGIFSVAFLRHNGHVSAGLDNGGEADPHDGVVVDDENLELMMESIMHGLPSTPCCSFTGSTRNQHPYRGAFASASFNAELTAQPLGAFAHPDQAIV